jgi:hypothetical protein
LLLAKGSQIERDATWDAGSGVGSDDVDGVGWFGQSREDKARHFGADPKAEPSSNGCVEL